MLFSIGKVRVTKRILESPTIRVPDLVDAFERYIHGDWGEMSVSDSLANDVALTSGEGVTGRYRLLDGTSFVMNTFAGVTTVQLPEEWELSQKRAAVTFVDESSRDCV
ncbi:hypothetical protein JI721_08225 [Alicyclobacillus cycloheptanicus]|uniref:Uncharacterized protein n=1 Tax=Alicyclobacillus cycloheptanicus TaxID=1457 RepID=A0ABT9XKF7_9BACL|nr:hypothetical protein [Alicyclobacillus cycloheptanicus]MDQ0190784.1 hypothetical protein [Alicyclobacillus cycloheptanicus]WDM02732.1 hypothetical protein JI721_08225 [Alicyclobacillus cycloheptanicus]